MSKIIHRGTLTLEKLKELCLEHLELKSDSDTYNPALNPAAISLLRKEDGHWTATMQKEGKLLTTRELIPEHALQKLLTHS